MNPRGGIGMSNKLLWINIFTPPTKMPRSLAFTMGETLLPDGALLNVPEFLPLIGRTDGIHFGPLEANASTRVEAAQADNAEVDLSQWT